MIVLEVLVGGAPDRLSAQLDAASVLCCREEGIDNAIAYGRLVSDEEIRRLNHAFRGIDRATDVLSFPSVQYQTGQTAKDAEKRLRRERDPETGLPHLGDFAISLPTAMCQAETYGHGLDRELCYLAVHAMLHLMGYDHESEADKAVMRTKEERVMAQLNLRRPNV